MLLTSFGLKTFDLKDFVVIVESGHRGNILANMALSLNAHEAVKINMEGSPVKSGIEVRRVISYLRSGKHTFLAPDGPFGPAHKAKPGAVFIAQKGEAIIVPCGGWTNQAFQLRRWDRYIVAIPFCKINIVFREPILISSSMDRADVQALMETELSIARNKAWTLANS